MKNKSSNGSNWTDGISDPKGSVDLERTLFDDDGNTKVLSSFSVDHLSKPKPAAAPRGEAEYDLGRENPAEEPEWLSHLS